VRCDGRQSFPARQPRIDSGALEAIERARDIPLPYLARHAQGDWGDLEQDDKAENESAPKDGLRLLSAYQLADGTKIWVITEADRSVTTILLPEEY
jgi:hypothetical protein